ncbi:32 kDa beta-galactoside-binding lectin lec-3-like [Haematobia irritans]|uniref:32 kDa beta-galactoside-binding lectin lec-3-like n=1 Tax=Haematobia irritans TaxID=7368 RepID=UPI003F509860
MSASFQGKLVENLDFGHILEIGAQAEVDGSWFSISLATGRYNESDGIDVALHILVNPHHDSIVIKQQIQDEWSEVARDDDYEGEIFLKPFKVNLIMDESKFHISINGKPLMFVPYGIPIKNVNTLKITGNLVSITQVDHRKYFPSPWPPIQLSEDRVHFSHDIPVSFQPGHVMVIMAKLHGDTKGRFIMHFRNAWNSKRQEVHVSMRFDKKKVIRNSKLPTQNKKDKPEKMVFGSEEKKGHFPFENFSMPFKVAVAFTATHFRMAKDGVFLFDYALRTPNVLPDIVGVKIFGIDGVTLRVTSIDHFRLDDPQCEGFENYSKKKF